ncbi:AfsR/SARP family transcriptional regulator [Thermobifida halotolerans]|uniref:AfsR/SARP family transcriptional regulator n=1 Tax=Thermobifida halotolerans TaxID=483545 RepID=A0AA97M034_9ACTN|nr:AfsR/SARP family transcriptional regulator [Thermobifida halotolerans]UOE21335.1 AfsR/SARP family transcriptional regulator [Thermobifida halotolerans]
MQFLLLGPLEVLDDSGSRITPTALRLRMLLSRLCMDAGSVVPFDQLKSALWPEGCPRTASTALQVSVSRLRKYLAAAGADPLVVATLPHGYSIDLKDHSLDVWNFRNLLAQARRQDRGGYLDNATLLYRQALEQWRGDAFPEMSESVTLFGAARALEEERDASYERLIELELNLGRHAMVVGELYQMTARFPSRERLCEHLMIALHRSGRTAEALQVYDAIRSHLTGELGIEPSDSLRRVHTSILSRADELDLTGSA